MDTTIDHAIVSSPKALDALTKASKQLIRTILKPRPRITGSEWANEFFHISAETGTEPGRYDWRRVPYQKEILDVCTDRVHQKVVLMTSARVGKTLCMKAVTGYYMHNDPSPIMWLLPTEQEAVKFSSSEVDPMLRDTGVLRELVKDKRVRDSGNLKLTKKYKGGHLSLVGAHTATGLHGKTIRVLLADEVDRFVESAGNDGDPLALAQIRTTTFQNRRKVILSSTPGMKDLSHIEREFERSDKRYYHVPCPHCDHYQKLVWSNLIIGDDPKKAKYECESCKVLIEEKYKFGMLQKGQWVAEAPDSLIAGFAINALYSVYLSWSDMAEEWRETKKNQFKLRVFINSRLGETWDDASTRVNAHTLQGRLEEYNAEVPTKDDHCNGIGILTAGVDVQGNRIEAAVWGFGANDESWLVDTVIFDGDTGQNQVWDDAATFLLNRQYKTKRGALVGIRAIAVDTGFMTEKVHRFVAGLQKRDRAKRTIFAVKGDKNFPRFVSDAPSQSKSFDSPFYKVGTDVAKELMESYLSNPVGSESFVHIPVSLPHDGIDTRWLDVEVLRQLTSEKLKASYKNGKVQKEWVKIYERNEQLDMRVYAYAALLRLGANIRNDLGVLAQKVSELEPTATTTSASAQPTDVPRQPVKKAPFKLHNSMNGINANIWQRR